MVAGGCAEVGVVQIPEKRTVFLAVSRFQIYLLVLPPRFVPGYKDPGICLGGMDKADWAFSALNRGAVGGLWGGGTAYSSPFGVNKRLQGWVNNPFYLLKIAPIPAERTDFHRFLPPVDKERLFIRRITQRQGGSRSGGFYKIAAAFRQAVAR